MVNTKDEEDGVDFGPASSYDGDNTHHSHDEDNSATTPADTATVHPLVAASHTSEDALDLAEAPSTTQDHPDDAADTTAAHSPVAASPPAENELSAPELQAWLTQRAIQRSRHQARLSRLLQERQAREREEIDQVEKLGANGNHRPPDP